MLTPDTRVLLGDALRPPEGFQLDVAVGTTYSLDLTALLLAPMSFAFVEPGEDLAGTDPASLLAAVRRYSERTTVFCQAGGIAVPGAYRRILTFVEGSVCEVTAPTAGHIFHPKVWVLRFVDHDGVHRHRLVVLSRNLTFDRSWDTALVLDESEDGHGVDVAPLVGFVRALPGLAVRPLPTDRIEQIADLTRTLTDARLAAPAPFDTVTLLPLGLDDTAWPLPDAVDRALAISPFLDVGAVSSLARTTANRMLVSRAETFTRLGGAALEGWQTRTLSRLAEGAENAELADDDDATPAHASGDGWGRVPDGLHAKVVVADVGSRGHVITGSANLTTAAWGGNVELGAHLSGPVRGCGVRAVLGQHETDGLARLLEEFVVADPEGVVDPCEATEHEVELFHQALAAGVVQVEVSAGSDDDAVVLTARVALETASPGRTRVWPITLRRDTHAQPLAEEVVWPDVSVEAVTPFLAVETTAGTGRTAVTRRCVVRAELIGDPPGRRQQAVHEILSNVDAVVRYLALLLADPTLGASAVSSGLTALGASEMDGAAAPQDVVLFEPLIRAAVRDRAGVERIAGMVEELRGGDALLPDGFEELWAVVREVVMDGAGS
ncbi:hypothetical protein GXB85_08465 [Cellulomonas sp. APG4]|uniref:phospholipase D family protein n=1 Tax=Cellulomonas sp. APG4 TaxID=1538656 RepID=UPI00137B0DD5|nr:phospholipase D family protein [Cellulomonas sp. APG4]NCT90977.1 hypothetical protein [Cellulomonas sp. APG4]